MTRIILSFIALTAPAWAYIVTFSKTNVKAGGLVALRLDLAPGDGEPLVTVNDREVVPRTHPAADADVRLLYYGVDLENGPERLFWRIKSPRREVTVVMPVQGPARVAQGVVNLSPAGKSSLLADYSAILKENGYFASFFKRPTIPQFLNEGAFSNPLPIPVVGSPFGRLRVYDNGARSYHKGVDFPVEEGTPVLTVGGGLVTFSATTMLRGEAVTVDHGFGLTTSYWHLSKRTVAVGDLLVTGDQVGEVGTTGLSTGPHLHWECRSGETIIDGLELLSLPKIFTP